MEMLSTNSGSNKIISNVDREADGFERCTASCQSGHMWIANSLIPPEENDLTPKETAKVNMPYF